ncbi:hypothetical protein C5167_047330 [Papaver somniferum]|uniref:Transposase-associated domain-containing protein n=1 Tax=Papaver somniferum TaxID=3469 RepID=A0A4Y7LK91_PAPSO|nr:hypothetical protein C5167_047330 [Papaver somniferum]
MSVPMEKKWMELEDRSDDLYLAGVKEFIDCAHRAGRDLFFSCPCKKCRNSKGLVELDDIEYDLLRWDIDKKYVFWHLHGESESLHVNTNPIVEETNPFEQPRMEDLVDDGEPQVESHSTPNDSDSLRNVLPEGANLPDNYPNMKNPIKELGMECITIHACPNHPILYRKEHAERVECLKCKMPRYKHYVDPKTEKGGTEPLKTVRYFPLIPRLKRLYSVPWIAKAMTWHKRAKSTDNLMRHPAGFHKASAFASEFGMQSKLHDPAPLCTGYYSRTDVEFFRMQYFACGLDTLVEIKGFLESFSEEPALVQLHLLTVTIKLFYEESNRRPTKNDLVLNNATVETDNPVLRDRAIIICKSNTIINIVEMPSSQTRNIQRPSSVLQEKTLVTVSMCDRLWRRITTCTEWNGCSGAVKTLLTKS